MVHRPVRRRNHRPPSSSGRSSLFLVFKGQKFNKGTQARRVEGVIGLKLTRKQKYIPGGELVYDPSRKSSEVSALVSTAHRQVQQFAEASADRAMYNGDFARALAFLEVAFEAQDRSTEPSGYLLNRHVQSLDRQYSVVAAMFNRPELIDHAIAIQDLIIEHLGGPLATDTAEGWVNNEQERRQYAVDHKADIPRYLTIRETVEKYPGIRQIDLTKHLPGVDNKRIARLVDHLEAAGFLATGTVGSRVQVWPADHPDAPRGDALRAPRWEFGSPPLDEDDEQLWNFDAFKDPEATLRHAQNFATLIDAAADDFEADTALIPTVLDFMDGHSTYPSHTRGSIVHMDTDRRSMAVWGHIDSTEALRILKHHLDHENNENISHRSRTKWLSTPPRHTYLERQAHAHTYWNGSTGNVFVLRETAEPTQHSVPVTAVSLPSKNTVEDAARSGGILWLAKPATRAVRLPSSE